MLKDADSRRRLRRYLLSGGYVFAVAMAELWQFRRSLVQLGPWMVAFYAFIFGTGFLAFQLIRRAHKNQDQLVAFSLTGRAVSATDEATTVVAEYLCGRAMTFASLLQRGASEFYLRTHEVEPDMEVIARRIQNEFLRKSGLWQSLDGAELQLVSAADGTWSDGQLDAIVDWCEQLRLLRFLLVLDSSVTPISHMPQTDVGVAEGLTDSERPMMVTRSRQPSDLRPVRDEAYGYLLSAALELKRRGLIEGDDSLESAEREMRVNFLQKQAEFVVDGKYVSELKDDELRYVLRLARTRWRYASYLIEQLNMDSVVAFSDWIQ